MKTQLISILFISTLMGCNASPLFNHEDEAVLNTLKSAEASDQVEPMDSSRCSHEFKKFSACVQLSWIKKQTNDEEMGEFLLTFTSKADQKPLKIKNSVFVKLMMPSMGHGSSPTKVEPMRDGAGTIIPGVFIVKNVYFSMPGDWEIIAQLRQEETVLDQVKWSYTY